MKSTEEFVRIEKFLHGENKKSIMVCVIALLNSLVLLARSAYSCYKFANPPVIITSVFFSFATLVIAILLWSSIRMFRQDSDHP